LKTEAVDCGRNAPLDETDQSVYFKCMSDTNKRKKQPQIVRALLLEAAAQLTAKRGLGGITLDLVAKMAGVSKGGLIHHFPSKQALIEGLFHTLVAAFEDAIHGFVEQDPNPRGRFTRGYVQASASPRNEPFDSKLIGACALAMSVDDKLAVSWRNWLDSQLEKHGEATDSVLGQLIRYSADGIWLHHCTDSTDSSRAKRDAVAERLITMTYEL
jgi:AcrR family transcriptional regulator